MVPAEMRDPQTYAVIGAAMEVHAELGCGFLEAVYHQALRVEFDRRTLPFRREVDLCIRYKDGVLDCTYRADFVCFGEVLIEIKAIKQLTDIDRAQVLHYLKATGLKRALLISFGAMSLEFERIVLGA
jgi:GxxExxY protein